MSKTLWWKILATLLQSSNPPSGFFYLFRHKKGIISSYTHIHLKFQVNTAEMGVYEHPGMPKKMVVVKPTIRRPTQGLKRHPDRFQFHLFMCFFWSLSVCILDCALLQNNTHNFAGGLFATRRLSPDPFCPTYRFPLLVVGNVV